MAGMSSHSHENTPADPTAPADIAAPAAAVSPVSPVSPADEILDIVDENDEVVGRSPRGEAYARGLRHRCVFILARDARGRVFVHRRTPTKLVFPSLYDMFVGGVVGAGESYDDAALREAEEELGVTGLPRPERLFKFLYENGTGQSWWSAVYAVRCELPVHPQVEEVAWHAFLTEDEVERRLGEWEWVPDGLAAYERLRRFRSAEST
ncbi:NUDIX hydrolase [Streptomyces graminilatus]|uniref:NUDIX hydrolase n=1 Tax=Streptomyces graminilatus TaxID=1464070 RepID=UPI00099E5F5C|nr:NUDIX domain-containing protein [Streptomyces graminilatus]